MSSFDHLLIFALIIAAMGLLVFFHLRPRKTYSNRLSQVRAGDRIKVNISGFVVEAECLNNSPETRKMFIRKFLSGGKISDTVGGYDEFTFINFDALNPVVGKNGNSKSTIKNLEDLMQDALSSEKYEDAAVLRDVISKLKKLKEEKICS